MDKRQATDHGATIDEADAMTTPPAERDDRIERLESVADAARALPHHYECASETPGSKRKCNCYRWRIGKAIKELDHE